MIFKIAIIFLLILMIYNLFRAMLTMNKNDPEKPPMSRYIGRRVLIAIAIILVLLLGLLTGQITPNPHP
jgi:heme/copper-type cytochrome/quinol oxidase subunit 2